MAAPVQNTLDSWVASPFQQSDIAPLTIPSGQPKTGELKAVYDLSCSHYLTSHRRHWQAHMQRAIPSISGEGYGRHVSISEYHCHA